MPAQVLFAIVIACVSRIMSRDFHQLRIPSSAREERALRRKHAQLLFEGALLDQAMTSARRNTFSPEFRNNPQFAHLVPQSKFDWLEKYKKHPFLFDTIYFCYSVGKYSIPFQTFLDNFTEQHLIRGFGIRYQATHMEAKRTTVYETIHKMVNLRSDPYFQPPEHPLEIKQFYPPTVPSLHRLSLRCLNAKRKVPTETPSVDVAVSPLGKPPPAEENSLSPETAAVGLFNHHFRAQRVVYMPPFSGKENLQRELVDIRRLSVGNIQDILLWHTVPDVVFTEDPRDLRYGRRSTAQIPSKEEFYKRCIKKGLEPAPDWYENLIEHTRFSRRCCFDRQLEAHDVLY